MDGTTSGLAVAAVPGGVRRLVTATVVVATFAVAVGAWLPLYAQLGGAVGGDPPDRWCTTVRTVAPGPGARLAVPAVVALVMALAAVRGARRAQGIIGVVVGLAWVGALICAGDPHDRGSHEEAVILGGAPVLALAVLGTVALGVAAAVRGRRVGVLRRPRRLTAIAVVLAIVALIPAARAVVTAGTSPHWLAGRRCLAAVAGAAPRRAPLAPRV